MIPARGAETWHLGLSVPGGLAQLSGGTIYNRHLVGALREAGARVDEQPFAARHYLAMAAENVRAPPRFPCHAWLQDELGHPGFLLRQRSALRAGPSPEPLRVAVVHNLRSSLTTPGATSTSLIRRRVVRLLERAYLGRVDAWVAVCRDTLEEMQRLHGARPAPPSLVLYAGKDHGPSLSPEAIAARAKRGSLRLLTVATVAPHKGAHRLLHLLAELPTLASATLTLVGSCDADPAYVKSLRMFCRAKGLDQRVHFLGTLTGEPLWNAYRDADVFALPSEREAFPLSGVEALGFGLPVLLTSHGGTRELITHEKEGFLLAPEERRAWAESLMQLTNPERRTQLGRAALVRHQSLPRWKDTAAVLLAFLSEVAKE